MSDNVATLTPELQHHLAMAFNEPLPTPATEANPIATESNQPAPASAAEPAAQAAPQATTATNQPTNQPPAEEGVVYIDPNEYLREQLGYTDWETAKREIQALAQKAQTPAQMQFANDQAKRWYEYFTADKEDDLYQALHARQQVKGIDTMTDENKVKLFIKMNNPMFDQELIDYQFKKDYGFDEDQFKDDNGVIVDQIGYRHAKVASLQRMQSDLQRANEFFNSYKSKIELPQIAQAAAAPTVDEAYENYKASTANALEAYEKNIAPALRALKEADLNMSFNINDPDNHMQFDFGITVDKDDFIAAQGNALSYNDHIEKTYYDEKGVFQPTKLMRAILLEANFDKYAQTIARQAVNAERKRMLGKEAPSPINKQFDVSPQVMNELDKQMQMAFSV